ncbi:MAG: ribonuclease III [Deltaproteobacteria bacterium]|nr:ribonuclease III [Deltaproteobacteria bacterium]
MAELENRLGYTFRDRARLEQALVHSSYAYECLQTGLSNERLEFLGDAVLNVIISDFLVQRHPKAREGDLSRWRASLVNARHLAGIARRLDLGSHLLLGRGEEQQSGRHKPSMLADALEAVLAAVFLDGGYEAAKEVVGGLFKESISHQEGKIHSHDFKTALQEYVQKWLKISPTYHTMQETGPAHARTFEVEVRLAGAPLGRGRGNSKKQASQQAACLALKTLQQQADPDLQSIMGQKENEEKYKQ